MSSNTTLSCAIMVMMNSREYSTEEEQPQFHTSGHIDYAYACDYSIVVVM